MLTQQAGHIEFGSFDFEFGRPSTQFDDLRSKLEAPPAYHDHDHGHEGHHEDAGATELSRFFRLFPGKRLARDIFSIVESGRVEAEVMREYRGIAPVYDEVRRQALKLRPEMTLLPAREALLEFVVRLTWRSIVQSVQNARAAEEIKRALLRCRRSRKENGNVFRRRRSTTAAISGPSWRNS
jgi:hypothetical protein